MRYGIATTAGLGLMLVLARTAGAAELPAGAPIPGVDPADYDMVVSESFMSAHPDMLYRLRGMGALDRGNGAEAERYFRLAARHADKLSQAFLAQMLWDGRAGVAQDRALAYAWMDLAAERGTPLLLVERERYWAALDTAERERAVREGKAIYAEYADDVAQPRLEKVMRLAQKNVVGSRTGSRAAMVDLCIGDWRISDSRLICNRSVSAARFYRDTYWKPELYWKWQERQLNPPREDIRLGAPEPVREGI